MKSIALTRGKHALVSDEDFERVSQYNWQARPYGRRWYASGRITGERRTDTMHRFIMGAPAGMDVDHINGDGLDNRRENLRVVTRAENLANRGTFKNNKLGVRGVRKTLDGKYRMIFQRNFDTPEEASAMWEKISRFVAGGCHETRER